MSTELSPSIYEDHIIHPQARLQLNTCGKEPGQRTSTTGQLDIVDVAATTKISHIYWDCKYGSPDTTWSVSEPPINDKWMVKSSKPSLVGALGTVTTEFIENVSTHFHIARIRSRIQPHFCYVAYCLPSQTTGNLNASPAVDNAT